MTDIEIVKTLAEFEGLYAPDEALQIYRGRCISDERELGYGYCGSAPFEVHQTQMNDPTSWVHSCVNIWRRAYNDSMPDYTTSYDAVAAVWKRLPIECADATKMFRKMPWYNQTPRQHAEALARAIIASKEQRNG